MAVAHVPPILHNQGLGPKVVQQATVCTGCNGGGVAETKSLRQRCERALAGIAVPVPFDLELLCQRIQQLRGKRLVLLPMPQAGGIGSPCGLYLATDDAEIICYDADTSPMHRDHIVLHEIGHMLLGHVSGAESLLATAARLMPDLDPQLIRSALARTTYDTQAEREAETMATLLRGSTLREPVSTRPENGAPDALTRLRASLGPR